MARPQDFDIQQVIEYLTGSCKTLQEGVNSFHPNMDVDDLTAEDHKAIDNDIFLCDTCNWWCERGDEAIGAYAGNCTNCTEEGDNEDNETQISRINHDEFDDDNDGHINYEDDEDYDEDEY